MAGKMDDYKTLLEIAQSSKAVQPAAVNRAGITQSYYTQPTTRQNYESGRPAYEQSDAVGAAAEAMSQHAANRPKEYEGVYEDQIGELIGKTLNAADFAYDYSLDPNYRQHMQRYEEQAREAMQGALDETDALSGGYGNSYGAAVGAQTYQRHLMGMNDVYPQMQAQAQREYDANQRQAMQNVGMMQSEEARRYGQYRDSVADWRNDLAFLYTQLGDMSQDEYNRYLNDQAAWEADRAYWYQKMYDEQQQENWEKEYDAKYGQKTGGGKPRTVYVDDHSIKASNTVTDVLAKAQEERRKKYEGK